MDPGHSCITQPTADQRGLWGRVRLGVEVSSEEIARVTSLPRNLVSWEQGRGEGEEQWQSDLSSQLYLLLSKHLSISATNSLHAYYGPGWAPEVQSWRK